MKTNDTTELIDFGESEHEKSDEDPTKSLGKNTKIILPTDLMAVLSRAVMNTISMNISPCITITVVTWLI